MTATGIHNGERYQLAPAANGQDVLLTIDRGGNGERLARALRGRLMPGMALTFYFTPARADKWRTLFMAGFTARLRMVGGVQGWMFERGDERLPLREAVRVARAEVMV